MFQYFEKAKELLSIVEEKEAPAIEQAIELLTKANLTKKAIYIFGASHAGILAEEMYYRAGGMMTINAIFGRELMLDFCDISCCFHKNLESLVRHRRGINGKCWAVEADLWSLKILGKAVHRIRADSISSCWNRGHLLASFL